MTLQQNTNQLPETINWILNNLSLEKCTSAQFMYNIMESQSCKCLPVIYQPFDKNIKAHFVDQAQIFDFQHHSENGKILDFGPGDGWPSLRIAPFVKEVIGIESSPLRIKVCTENAKKLNVKNAKFICVQDGQILPFVDNTFDSVIAASSVELTSNPESTLCELYRVLKKQGTLRLYWEKLEKYKKGKEFDLWVHSLSSSQTDLIIFERHIKEEYIRYFRLRLVISKKELEDIFKHYNATINFSGLTIEILEIISKKILNAAVMITKHPLSNTMVKWVKNAGFKSVQTTYSGGWFANKLFDVALEENLINKTFDSLYPIIKTIVKLKPPPEIKDVMITATK